MNSTEVNLSEIKSNPNNPRIIKDDKFHKLVESIKTFPRMLEIRPIVVNKDMIVLGGNMRLKACKEAGIKKVHVIFADDLTEEQQREFIIKDNVGFGEWDWAMLANEWDYKELDDWGLTLPNFDVEPDYSILDDNKDIDSQLEDMNNGTRKAIQIEFEIDDYDNAFSLVKYYRDKNIYVGKMIIEHLKAEKDKL
jgi:hypothetical protein